jgi:hypothetical protein
MGERSSDATVARRSPETALKFHGHHVSPITALRATFPGSFEPGLCKLPPNSSFKAGLFFSEFCRLSLPPSDPDILMPIFLLLWPQSGSKLLFDPAYLQINE